MDIPLQGSARWTMTKKRILVAFFAMLTISIALPPFQWPVAGSVSSGFLFRLEPGSKALRLDIHHGIDIAAARGSTIRATALGIVSEIGQNSELGKYAKILHPFGFQSIYAHMDRITAKKGGFMVPGLSAVGLVGSSGYSTGPHLHFGLYFFAIACPPEAFLLFHSIRRRIIGL